MKKDLILSLLMTFTVLPYVHIVVSFQQVEVKEVEVKEVVVEAPKIIEREFGFRLDSFQLEEKTIKNGQTLGDLLKDLDVDYENVIQVVENCKGIFNYKSLRSGKPYYIVEGKDSTKRDSYFVYQPNPIEYYTISLQDSFSVTKEERPVEIRKTSASGEITYSLWNALVDNGIAPDVAVELSEIYAWTVNFFALQRGDKFKLIFNEKWVGDERVGMGEIEAAIFHHGGKDFYAIPFVQDNDLGFYNADGKSLEADFLKAPVKFSRISSGFSGRRFHPVQKRWKAHLGTDFAAPRGTPIMSTANGTVVAATFSKYNGNYVKVKHNETISTQYLHMSKIAKGIRPGIAVKQGEVIGYIGSTGLATGPHVCYRFWMNGKQVNSQKVKISSTRKIKGDYKAKFDSTMNVWLKELKNIPYPQDSEMIFAESIEKSKENKKTSR